MSARRWSLGAWSLVLLGSCSKEEVPATQAVVVVNSDLEVGTAITSVTAQVLSADGKTSVAEPFSFALAKTSGSGRHALPLSFGIAQPSGGADSFRVVIAGYGPGGSGGASTRLVEQKALVTFQEHQTLRLTAFLGRVCTGKVCGDNACYPVGTSGVGAGECGPVTASQLSIVEPNDELDGVVWPEAGSPAARPAVDAGDAGPTPAPDGGRTVADGGVAASDGGASYVGFGYNQAYRGASMIAANLTVNGAGVTGFINFSQIMGDLSPNCGAGSLMSTRQGNAITGYFISDDPDLGCGFDRGKRINTTGEVTDDGDHFWGEYVVGALGSAGSQPGVFELWRRAPDTTLCTGSMTLTGGSGATIPLSLSVALGRKTLFGRWDGQDSSVGAACSQGSFAGVRTTDNAVDFSFVHSDERPGCSDVLGLRQYQLAILSADRTQLSGTLEGPKGTGTFSISCPTPL